MEDPIKYQTIRESINLNDYDAEDFVEVFIYVFRDWVKKNVPQKESEYPISYLFKKYKDKFCEDMGIEKYITYSQRAFQTLGRRLVEKSLYKLPDFTPQEKWTSKPVNQKILNSLIGKMNLPPYITLKIDEEKNYNVTILPTIDLSESLKSPIKNEFWGQSIPTKLMGLIKKYGAVKLGKSTLGELDLEIYTPSIDDKGWDKEFKKLRKETIEHIESLKTEYRGKIRQFFFGFEWGRPCVYLRFNTWRFHTEIIREVEGFLQKKGYNTENLIVREK